MTKIEICPGLIILLLLGVFPCKARGIPACGFKDDPLCFHENLRRRAMEGADNRDILEHLHSGFKEHSFDGLLKGSPKGNAGFILLYSAWSLWGQREYRKARDHYLIARNLFQKSGMDSEASFCLYYMAGLASEEEKFPESLKLLAQALEESRSLPAPYLGGLINESLGYALWYMDLLPESAESFLKAADLWGRIDYKTGMVNCLSNLGLLYQELDLPGHAWRSYEIALQHVRNNTLPETKFLLYRNCALFHYRNRNPVPARDYLLKCREFRHCGEDLYILAKSEILEQPDLLSSVDSEFPSINFIRDLLKARFSKKAGEIDAAIRMIRNVIRESQAGNLPRHTREARLFLAEILEEQGHTAEARQLFSDAWNGSGTQAGIDVLLPFSRSAERQLSGLVRCLLREGETKQARDIIQKAVCLKTSKGKKLLSSLKEHPGLSPENLQFNQVIRSSGLKTNSPEIDPVPADNPASYSVVEIWPDGKEIFIWIDNPSSRHFLSLELDNWIQDTIPMLTSALYSREPFLPPRPPEELSNELYQQLFKPMERLLAGNRLLIIAHKELQSLPFEMLRTDKGRYLLEKYTFSYLPGKHFINRFREIRGSPALIQPEVFSGRSGAVLELNSLKSIYPDLEILNSLDLKNSLTAGWIHIGSHLRLDRRYWLHSTLTDGKSSKTMADLLKKDMNCTLLSMGVCESANSDLAASPYWMGFSEMLLLNGAETLLTSRWRMDELSANIYTEFFRLCSKGLPMDEALKEARLKYLHPDKFGLPAHASHPFYWAGITYVGQPGSRLPGSGRIESRAVLVPVILWLILAGAFLLRKEFPFRRINFWFRRVPRNQPGS